MIFAKYLPHMYQGAEHTGRRVLNMGGGGGGSTTSTTYTSNIPEWLRPQTEALLGAGTQEYFNTKAVPGQPARYDSEGRQISPATPATYEITGIKPFRPYSEDKESYFAPFTQQQQNVFSEVGGMRTPTGFQTGQQLTGAAGAGGLGTVQGAYGYGGQGAGYGGQGAGYGQQAAGMGGLYERMATDPMSVEGYMSPYMQQVVERQKLAAIEDAQRANLGANLGSVRSGTYGGARQTLAQSQREAALEKQLGDIQAGGLQSAFEQAQKAQQFGVTAGLQGLQTGVQGAGLGITGAGLGLQGVQAAQAGYGLAGQMGRSLADIAGAQQQADIQRVGLQSDIGAQQQAREQGIIDQRIQDFALAEQYPFQQLSGYSGLLRGYSTPTSTISQYRAAQSPITQLAGTGIQLGGAAQALGVGGGRKAGGQIKSYAQGGITSVDALESMAEDLSIPQIQQSVKNKTLPGYVGIPILENKVNNAERMKMAQGIAPDMGQEPPIADQVMARADALQGIDSVATGAGGGMVAFNNGGVARFQNQGLVAGEPEVTQEMLEEERKRQEMFLGTDPRIAKTKELLGKQGQESGLDRAMRGLQYVVAGEKIKREGDTSQLEKITQSEMARRKEMTDRQMKLAELEGVDYQQRAGIYKDVTGRQREKARIAAEQKFKSGQTAAEIASKEKVAALNRRTQLEVANSLPDAIRGAEAIRMPGESLGDALSRYAESTNTKDQYNAASNLVKVAFEAGSKRFENSIGGSGGNYDLSRAAGGDKKAQDELKMTQEEAEKELKRIKDVYLKEAYSDVGMAPEIANLYLRAPKGSAVNNPLSRYGT
jgi:hypothetical protein